VLFKANHQQSVMKQHTTQWH